MTIYDARSASPLLDLLFEDDLVARCLVAPDETVLRANDAWLRSTGFSPDDVLGANIIDLFPGTRDMALAMHTRARAGHRVEVPRHAQIVNGRETWWEGRLDPVPMDGGMGLLITGREGGPAGSLPPGPERHSRHVLDPAWLWALVNSLPNDVTFVDTSGTVLFVNNAVRSRLGLSDLQDVRNRMHEDEAMSERYTTEGRRRRGDESPFIEASKGRAVDGDEVVRNVKTGELRHRRYRVAPVHLDGKIIGAVSVVRDVTDLTKANQAHSETEALLRLALDAGQMVAWDYNPTTRRVTVSEYAVDLLAMGSKRVREPSLEGFLPVHPDDVEAHTTRVMEATKRGGAYASEFRRVMEDGEIIWLEERGRSVTDGFGGTRLVGITQNVTERKRAEIAVRESEDRLQEATHRLMVATEAARLGIYDYDVASGMVRWDARVRELWGVGPDEPITYEMFMAGLHPDDRAATQAGVDGALDPTGSGKFRSEYRVIHRRDGRERWIEATGQGIFVEGQPSRLIGTVQNATGRKRAGEASARATERLAAATEAARLGIHDYDLVSGVIWWDARVRELWGVEPDEPITYEVFMAGIHPDDRAATQAAVDGALDPHGDGGYRAEYRVIHRRDGRVRWIEATGQVRFVGGKPSRLIGAIQEITSRTHAVGTAQEVASTP